MTGGDLRLVTGGDTRLLIGDDTRLVTGNSVITDGDAGNRLMV